MSKTVKASDVKAGKTFYTATMRINKDGSKVVAPISIGRHLSRLYGTRKEPRIMQLYLDAPHLIFFETGVKYALRQFYNENYPDGCVKTQTFKRRKDAEKALADFMAYHTPTEFEKAHASWGS